MKDRYGIDATLKPSHGGIFDVEVDGRMIYSKKETKRFPELGEVPGLIDAATGKPGA